jgi:hypothetical protein
MLGRLKTKITDKLLSDEWTKTKITDKLLNSGWTETKLTNY